MGECDWLQRPAAAAADSNGCLRPRGFHGRLAGTVRPVCAYGCESGTRLEFWPFSGPFRVQKIIFSFRKIFSQYSVPY